MTDLDAALDAVDHEGAVLVVPTGLVLPAAARDRLRRRYAERPDGVRGVVAPVTALPPGSSVLTTADRCAGSPDGDGATMVGTEIAGAALLAPDVAHVVDDRTIRIEDPLAAASLRLDPGATAFDPSATEAEPAPPGGVARPPFRWRPVVLLLTSRPDPARAQVGAALANALLGLDVEARLAVHDAPEGPLLTRPVPPDAASIAALRPDLVLALDPDAVALAERAVADVRTTVVALVDPALGDGIELVSWQIDRAQGRLRARLGADVDRRALVDLVNRLCAGPVPEPPADPERTGREVSHATPVMLDRPASADPGEGVEPAEPSLPATTVRATFASSETADPLLAGLLDHLRARGVTVLTTTSAATSEALLEVFVAATPPDPATSVVVRVVDGGARAARPRGADPIATRAITDSWSVADRLREDGITTIVLPRLRTRSELDRATGAHERRVRPAVPTIGLLVDDVGRERIDELAPTIRTALDRIRSEHPDLLVVVTGEDGERPPLRAPHVALDEPWILCTGARPDADELAGWTAALWLGPPRASQPARAVDAPDQLIRAALVGLPVVLPADAVVAAGALADRSLAVDQLDDPGPWATSLGVLVDDERRAVASDRARTLAVAVHGGAASALVVDRFLGWCRGAPR